MALMMKRFLLEVLQEMDTREQVDTMDTERVVLEVQLVEVELVRLELVSVTTVKSKETTEAMEDSKEVYWQVDSTELL